MTKHSIGFNVIFLPILKRIERERKERSKSGSIIIKPTDLGEKMAGKFPASVHRPVTNYVPGLDTMQLKMEDFFLLVTN